MLSSAATRPTRDLELCASVCGLQPVFGNEQMEQSKKRLLGVTYLVVAACVSGIAIASPETTTTTTTVTDPDGSTTQTVEETTTTTPPDTSTSSSQNQPNLIGPTGATGVIRRSDRRQDRRDGDPRID